MATADLAEFLELGCCECFNADDALPLRNALAEDCRDNASMLLQSDVDEGAPTRQRQCTQPRRAPLRARELRVARVPCAVVRSHPRREPRQLRTRTHADARCAPCSLRPRRAELLVILRFRQLVKVSAIAIKAPADKGPSSMKVRARCAVALSSLL